MRIYYWIRCKWGYPICNMEIRDGYPFAICRSCHRQAEIHY